jgi:hypothetical protein
MRDAERLNGKEVKMVAQEVAQKYQNKKSD